MHYDWNFKIFLPYTHAFMRGLAVTLELSIVSSLVGTVIGFVLGILFRIKWIARILIPINDIVRAVPMLVLMFFFYYFPYQELFPWMKPLSAFGSAMMALTVAQAAFTAEIVRAAVDGVSQKLILGGRALGLRESTIWQYIIIPDVMRQIMPSLIAFYIGNIKLSSIASVIGAEDVVFVAREAASNTFRSLEVWVIVALIYALLVLPLSYLSRKFERSAWLTNRT